MQTLKLWMSRNHIDFLLSNTHMKCSWVFEAAKDVTPNRMKPDDPTKWSIVNVLKSPITT